MKLADAQGALAWSRVSVNVPKLVFIARFTRPEVGTSPEGVPTSLRFGFSVVSGVNSQVLAGESLAAVFELSLPPPRPAMSAAAPPTTTTATTTTMISRLRRRLRCSSARRSIWRWRRRWAACRRCLLVGTDRLLEGLLVCGCGAPAGGVLARVVRHPAARRGF